MIDFGINMNVASILWSCSLKSRFHDFYVIPTYLLVLIFIHSLVAVVISGGLFICLASFELLRAIYDTFQEPILFTLKYSQTVLPFLILSSQSLFGIAASYSKSPYYGQHFSASMNHILFDSLHASQINFFADFLLLA